MKSKKKEILLIYREKILITARDYYALNKESWRRESGRARESVLHARV